MTAPTLPLNLIEAAPALLSALEALQDPEGHITHGDAPRDDAHCTGECKAARAAIALAQGVQ